jgi:hypothetical protein
MSIAPKRRPSFGRKLNGFKVLLDLNKHDKAEAVQALEAIIAPLKGWSLATGNIISLWLTEAGRRLLLNQEKIGGT